MGREQLFVERVAAELNAELLNLEKVYVCDNLRSVL